MLDYISNSDNNLNIYFYCLKYKSAGTVLLWLTLSLNDSHFIRLEVTETLLKNWENPRSRRITNQNRTLN